MVKIPRNNLRERLSALGYNPNGIQITEPVLDNSRVIVPDIKPSTTISYQNKTAGSEVNSMPNFDPDCKPSTSYQNRNIYSGSDTKFAGKSVMENNVNFKPPVIENIDEWSDFED